MLWNQRTTPWLLALPTLIIIALLVVVPTIRLLEQSLRPADTTSQTLTSENFRNFSKSAAARQASARTLRVSLFTTSIAIIAGYPVAYFLARTRSKVRGLLLALVLFPLMTSVIVRAYGWSVILGRSGLVNSLLEWLNLMSRPLRLVNNETGIIVGVTHVLLPYMILSLTASMQRMDPNLEEAAQSLGANPLVVFTRIVFPLSLPGLLTGTLLVFSLSVTAYATPLMLGGSRSPVLTTLLSEFAFSAFDWTKASTVGIVLLLIGMTLVFLQRQVTKRSLKAFENE